MKTTVNALFDNVATTQHDDAQTTAFYCVQQVIAQNKANADKYAPADVAFAKGIYNMCADAFIRSTCYFNLRDKFISVKVANVTKQCLISDAVTELQAFIAQHDNIKVKQTKNALIFNISF